jgi:hypothetical protein
MEWLVKQFPLWGATFQSWMVLALAIILMGVLLALRMRREALAVDGSRSAAALNGGCRMDLVAVSMKQ